MISAKKISFLWDTALAVFGIGFRSFGILTLVFPAAFAGAGLLLGLLGLGLAAFFLITGGLAGRARVAQAWDEGAEHDSGRAYKFGFTIAWVVYVIFGALVALEWVRLETAFPAMGAFTGGSYCLFKGLTGLRGWYATRHAPD